MYLADTSLTLIDLTPRIPYYLFGQTFECLAHRIQIQYFAWYSPGVKITICVSRNSEVAFSLCYHASSSDSGEYPYSEDFVDVLADTVRKLKFILFLAIS